MGALAVGALLQPDLGGSGTGTAQGPDADDAPADTPDDAGGSAIEWPANMATGGIIFGADGAIAPSDALEPGTAPQQAEVQRDGVQNDVLIYVDYRCPHCASFEEANGDLLEDALEDGTTTIEVVPLVFLDRASEGSYYSSRAASAMACLADARVAGAWEFHSELLDPSVQPQSGAGPTNEQLIELAEDATDAPLDPTVADCITSERFVPFVQALNDWVFANPVPNAIDAELRVSGTPMAVVNGVPYAGEPSDGAAFRAFFEAQTR
ncbi:DsbA family protein [Leucobacter soli]|uniref:DsbA family protein n=1 Tax=Leucobacter soli TaxID=2812850 RepID=UPI00361D4BF1